MIRALADVIMRAAFDEPSPLERWCGRALGLPEAALNADTGLIDWISAEQCRRGRPTADYAPPADFYDRFEALLEAEYGPLAALHDHNNYAVLSERVGRLAAVQGLEQGLTQAQGLAQGTRSA